MMADSLQARGPRDQINIHDASELRYWSNKFEVEPKYLRQAVLIVGPRVKDVEGSKEVQPIWRRLLKNIFKFSR